MLTQSSCTSAAATACCTSELCAPNTSYQRGRRHQQQVHRTGEWPPEAEHRHGGVSTPEGDTQGMRWPIAREGDGTDPQGRDLEENVFRKRFAKGPG